MASCPRCGAATRAGALFCTRCGVRLAAASSPPAGRGGSGPGLHPPETPGCLPVGTLLQGGRYEVIGQLGQGGMGAVYLVRDRELFGRLCVVKQMHPFFASASERRKAEEDFKREAEVLARLNQPGHPRIPEVYGYFVEAGDQYLVMKYIEGESLERRLERLGRPLAEAEVVRCAIEVADALIYLHNRRPQPVIHRDIKPANIIVDAEDRVWLVDFGLARAVASPGARVVVAGGKTVAAGTPGYTPLEQWQMQASPKSDVYALGATLHHLLSGADPRDRFTSFAELDLEVLRTFSHFRPLSELRPDLSPALSALVARCLAPDAEARPRAHELKLELGRLVPTGSRLFDTVRRWSPTLGEVLGTALATFVRSVLRPSAGRQEARGRIQDAGGRMQEAGRHRQHRGSQLTIACLFCRGQGTTRDGRACPVCGGSGVWWQDA